MEYEALPAVFDPEVAMSEDTPVVIHPSGKGPGGKVMGNNQCHWYGAEDGDLAKGFAEADLIIENRFTTGMAQCTPKLNKKEDPKKWLSDKGAPWAKLANEKPKGETIAYDKLLGAWKEGRVR